MCEQSPGNQVSGSEGGRSERRRRERIFGLFFDFLRVLRGWNHPKSFPFSEISWSVHFQLPTRSRNIFRPAEIFWPEFRMRRPAIEYTAPKVLSIFGKVFSIFEKVFFEAGKVFSKARKVFYKAEKVFSKAGKVFSKAGKVFSIFGKVFSKRRRCEVFLNSWKVFAISWKVFSEFWLFYFPIGSRPDDHRVTFWEQESSILAPFSICLGGCVLENKKAKIWKVFRQFREHLRRGEGVSKTVSKKCEGHSKSEKTYWKVKKSYWKV